MSSEAQIRSSLQIRKNNLTYQSQPTAFVADVSGTNGPTPGAFTVPVAGIAVDLSKLTTPGLCRIMNLDLTNYVEYGIKDVSGVGIGLFYPLGEILPGESYVIRLSRNITEEYTATGTGTTPKNFDNFWFKAHVAPVNVLVEAFEA